MKNLNLVLPFPPSVNHYWCSAGRRRYISLKGRIFRKEVFYKYREFKDYFGDESLAMTIEYFPPNKIKRDIDNQNKAPLDAMQHAKIYDDDNQIKVLLTAMRNVDKENPRAEVHIESRPIEELSNMILITGCGRPIVSIEYVSKEDLDDPQLIIQHACKAD